MLLQLICGLVAILIIAIFIGQMLIKAIKFVNNYPDEISIEPAPTTSEQTIKRVKRLMRMNKPIQGITLEMYLYGKAV